MYDLRGQAYLTTGKACPTLICMPRPTRVQNPDAFYHVMNRGRGRQTIFYDEACFRAFLDTLAESHERFDAIIHTHCLMKTYAKYPW